jgi:MSHA biogenesis protein MshJ
MTQEEALQRYSALSSREKFLVVIGAVAVVYMVLQFVLLDPVSVQVKALRDQQATYRQDIKNLESEQLLLLQSMNKDPDAALKQQVETMQQQLQALDKELTELSVGLVPAKQLPMLLQDVLRKTGKLELRRMQTLPVTNLQLQALEADTAKVNRSVHDGEPIEGSGAEDPAYLTAGVFKHAVRMELSGSYFQVLSYLEALESLNWRFYWQSLSYQVEAYPRAVITLDVYTLSTEEGLFSG